MPHVLPQLMSPAPHLTELLEKTCFTHCPAIKEWLAKQWQLTPPPFYGSVDLRNAGFKLAPIDMNLFPAGFNNLNPNFLNLSVQAAQQVIARINPALKKVLIIPESHTRNLMYWENIHHLQTILTQAGFQVRLGVFDPAITAAITIEVASGAQMLITPLARTQNRIGLPDFMPDLILLNNDLSNGMPTVLQNIEQPIVPPAELGWHQRLKSNHFQFYAQVAKEFAEVVKIDPWLIDPLFAQCGQINFMQQDGLECLRQHAEQLFARVEAKYKEYNLKQQPFLIMKADSGTYGMAVMTIRQVEELASLNRKQRTRMATTKGGQQVSKVILQEGVYTYETWGEEKAVAEPVVYLLGEQVIGGFYRIHKDRGIDENLNSPGMHFTPIAFPQSCNEPCSKQVYQPGSYRYYLYGVVAQLSMLAAAREIKGELCA